MRISELENKITKTPVIISTNRESLLCLNQNFEIIEDKDICNYLDFPQKQLALANYVIFSNSIKCLKRFPKIGIKEPFWRLNFNDNLASKYNLAKRLFLNQSKIKNVIQRESSQVDFIVLIIVDGLSYLDCSDWDEVTVQPCLVDTVTITEFGFKNIVGIEKTIANRLFEQDYNKFIGFSYWEKDNKNELTDSIFKGFGTVNKVQSLKDVVPKLKSEILNKCYIQIATSGLDGLAHKCREEPLIEATVKQLKSNIDYLKDELIKTKLKGLIYVTSDHGILWKHQMELTKIPFEHAKNVFSPRYYESSISGDEGIVFSNFGKNIVAVKAPYILRKLRSNEWGVHGGVSLEESIIPFATIKVN